MPRRRYYQSDKQETSDDFEVLKPEEELEKEKPSISEDENVDLEEDSDSAPEDVTFLASKASALSRIRGAMHQIGKEKNKLKQKRRMQIELYEKQKRQKLGSLEEKRLPDEFFEEMAKEAEASNTVPKELDGKDVSEDPAIPEHDSEGSQSDADSGLDEDFVPLTKDRPGNIHALCLKEELRKPKTSAESAAEFRQKMLYRNNVPRETTKAKMSKMVKRRARQR